jgi:hypothetical protein
MTTKSSEKAEFEVKPFEAPLFDVNNETALTRAKSYLEKNGYAVYTNVISPEQIEHAKGLLWDWLEGLGTGISREDPETWGNSQWPEDFDNGIIFDYGIGQSEFLWYLRGQPNVRHIFSSLWGTEELFVSFDGCGVFRPTKYNPNWRTKGGWFHVDQNGLRKQGCVCFQGLINLVDAGVNEGGLVVGPGTQLKHAQYFKTYPKVGRYNNGELKGDFIKINPNHLVEFFKLKPKKLCLPAGGFIVWDSRTIHCNTPALNPSEITLTKNYERIPHPFNANHSKGKVSMHRKSAIELERIVAYICMLPPPTDPKVRIDLVKKRIQAVSKGITTNHWPNEYTPSKSIPPRDSRNMYEIKWSYQDITPRLDDNQKRLIGMLPYTDNNNASKK